MGRGVFRPQMNTMAELLQVEVGPTPRATILIVSVPDHQQYALCRYAELAGYHVMAVGDLSGFDWRLPLDLIVCEHRDPQIDAAKLCRFIRLHSDVPILALISTNSGTALTAALNAGADMCLVSPYDTDQFTACVRAVLRRSGRDVQSFLPLNVGDFRVVKETQQCTVRGQQVHLTTQEFRLVHYLVQHPYRVLSHEDLLHAIWGAGCKHKVEFLRPVVMSLRKKLERDWRHPDYIRTAHKDGYFFLPTLGSSEAGAALSISDGDSPG